MKKYTAEQVSRILSAAANGELGAATRYELGMPGGCIEQVALAVERPAWEGVIVWSRANAFDDAGWFAPEWKDPDATLRWLEQQGMV